MKKNILLKANASLALVLIITAVIISGSIMVLMSSMDLSNSTKDSFNLYLNEMRSRSCIEEGLNRLKNNSAYVGSVSISYTDGICTVNIANDPANSTLKDFVVNSTLNTYNYTISKKVDISTEPYTLL
jgi:hypothetical protein